MDKLEHYLEQACRGIAGPRAMRQHLREELRQHLNDAIDEHVAHGMPRDEAISRALEDFGGADQLRSELEATHGHRLMTVMIDKALDWKERTMKAKWIWSSWAHLALVVVVLVELFGIVATSVFVVPKYEQIMRDVWNTPEVNAPEWNNFVARTNAVFHLLRSLGESSAWILIGLVIAWALFEWRVRSENKSFMRLSALASIAVLLGMLSVVLFASMILPTMIAVPNMRAERPETLVAYNTQRLNSAATSLDAAIAEKNWEAINGPIMTARNAIDDLAHYGAAAPSVIASSQPAKVQALRNDLRSAADAIHDAELALISRDTERFSRAMKQFHQAYDPTMQSTTRP